MTWPDWHIIKLGYALRQVSSGDVLIKGDVETEPGDRLWPGYSASGQDVWLRRPQHVGPGLVLSAVGARCGRVFLADGKWGVVANTTVFAPQQGHHPRFLWYLVNQSDFWEKGGTAQPYVRVPETLSRRLEVPSLEEQRAIADFLDVETARIDALIDKKRRLITLLDERFEAEVFHSMTCGLNRNVALMDSGIEWAPKMPAHWSTPPVSANFDLQLGKMLNAEAADGPDQYPYLRNVNVQWDRLVLEDLATMHFSEGDRRRCELRAGDVLVCEGGEVGRAAVWAGEVDSCYFQKAIHRVRPLRGANGRYLMYCLRAAAKASVFVVEGNQSTIVHLTGEQLRAHRFPWPPASEQQQIVERLDRLANAHASVGDKLARQIGLLEEKRGALITAAVTGAFAVPGASAA